MKFLVLSFLLLITGCVSTSTNHFTTIDPQSKIYVEPFNSAAGKVISDIIGAKLHKNNMLAPTKAEASLILTGSAFFRFGNDGVSFKITDKQSNILLAGDATSGGSSVPTHLGNEVAKKIIKQIKTLQKSGKIGK